MLASHATVTAGAVQAAASVAPASAVAAEANPLDGSLLATPAAAGTAAATGPVLAQGVAMQDMIDSIHATIEIASREGISQARIALKPDSLGQISIHLSQSSDGLLARVTADTSAAAQTLAGRRAELHQSLSSLGVSLLRLDIGSSGQSQTGDREEGSGTGAGGSAAAGSEEAEAGEPTATLDGSTTTAGTASGGLVDVLA